MVRDPASFEIPGIDMKMAFNPGGAAWPTWRRWLPASLLGESTHQGIISLLDQAVVSGTRFLTTVIVGRMCGAEELGSYALGFSVVVLIAVLQESLITTPYAVLGAGAKGGARRRYAGSLLVHHILLAALAVTLLGGFGGILLLRASPSLWAAIVWVLAATMPFALLREFARKFAFANLRVTTALILDVLFATIQLGGLVILSATGTLSTATAFLVLGLASGVAGLACLVAERQRFRLRRRRVGADLRRNLSFGKWICGSQVVSVVSGYSVYWLLTLLVDAEATGVYAACASVVMLANPFILGMCNLIGPKTARAWAAGGKADLHRLVRRITFVMGSFMAFYWLAVALAGEQLIVLLFDDPAFAGHGHVMTVLGTSVVISAVGVGFGDGLKAMGRPDWNFGASVVDLVVMLLTAVPLAWCYGMVGAAYCLLAGSIAGLTFRYLVFSYLIKRAD